MEGEAVKVGERIWIDGGISKFRISLDDEIVAVPDYSTSPIPTERLPELTENEKTHSRSRWTCEKHIPQPPRISPSTPKTQ